ncbi:DUF2922 domain-containing protein [Companilactobacillus halodurans]|uniref:DUF2922 domain-containing protein n=1 Tax=Companilactobacillus halodurans TaxID=2584183 RepID=A0A5P1A0E7_9LACO|nr:DUF2922 domain-containing protein [Companilactobacillus halodurans]MQS76931.1 DUF2922 domain-containing protein [Companilactobacillus halodurans]MQS98565.1 DUF2922 domain-containing protein [Companilactobacillus halodurans]
MKKLQLKFQTAEGQKKNLVLNYVKSGLDENATKAAMEKISASKLFERNTVQLYATTVGASYIDRTETTVF